MASGIICTVCLLGQVRVHHHRAYQTWNYRSHSLESQDFVQHSGQKLSVFAALGQASLASEKIRPTCLPPPSRPWRVSGGGHRQATWTTVHIFLSCFLSTSFTLYCGPNWPALVDSRYIPLESALGKKAKEFWQNHRMWIIIYQLQWNTHASHGGAVRTN